MKTKPLYGVFRGDTALFNLAALEDMVRDIFDEMGLDITYLRWDNEKKHFQIAFDTPKDAE